MKYLIDIFRFSLLVLIFTSCHENQNVQLFDGHSFSGWEGSMDAFRIQDGSIIGGSLEKGLDESYYLCTTKEYSDFELSLSVKLIHKELKGNAGVSFGATRVNGSNRVASYQADIGYITPDIVVRCSDYTPADMISQFSLWGTLIDECRDDLSRYPDPEFYPAVILEMPERELIQNIVKPYEWNDINILVKGQEIQIKVNGITTVKFTENQNISTNGTICLQAHQGDPYEVHYKDIVIKKIN